VSEQLVSRQRDGHVLVVRMGRQAKRNAINRELADAIDEALNELDDDPELWVGVLTGGPTYFSAGSDLTAGGDYFTDRGGEYGIIRRLRSKPLVAAVEGYALGGGMEIVLACDMVVAASNARFGLPEVGIGVIPTCAGIFRAPQSLPLNLAREMIFTGEAISAERAYAAGFVNALTEPGAAVEGAIALAQRIARNAPLSVQACLTAVNEQLAPTIESGWEATERAKQAIFGTDDSAEGVRSFLEKRPPQWKAR
jgi:enoyl-CoA hydratase/carnithine racemase